MDYVFGVSSRTPCCFVGGNATQLSRPGPGEICVALGVGDGGQILDLARAVGEEGAVYGVEMSKDVLRKTQRHVEQLGVDNIDFIHDIFEEIELEDGIADLVVSDCSMAFAQDKARVWDEIARLLKPGGRFFISDVFSETPVDDVSWGKVESLRCLAELLSKDAYFAVLDKLGFSRLTILEESAPHAGTYLGRPTLLTSFIVSGRKPRTTSNAFS